MNEITRDDRIKMEPSECLSRAEIDDLNKRAFQLVIRDGETAGKLARRALASARNGDSAEQPYHKGIAHSLHTLGKLAKDSSNYQLALHNLLEALGLLDPQIDLPVYLNILDDLAWVYFNLGDSALAVKMLLQALKISRQTLDHSYEGNLLNTLGAIYGEIGEKELSIDAAQRALAIFQENQDFRNSCLALNNLAMTQMEIQASREALENAEKSLEIAIKLESPDLIVVTLDTIGQIYLTTQNFSEAETYFLRAQANFSGRGIDPDEIALNLAKAILGQGRSAEAEKALCKSLESVKTRQAQRFLFRIHLLLSQIYQEQGDLEHALEQYKLFHSIKRMAYNEDTQRQITNLIILFQTDSAQIEAEVIRLRNTALRQNITEQNQAIARMEIQATTDSLTGMFNRRHFLTLAGYCHDAAKKQSQPLAVFMIDIDNFKDVNDRYGHLAGDKVLAETGSVIRSCMRSKDLLCRYGGEEFIALVSNEEKEVTRAVGERIVKKIADHITHYLGQSLQVTVSIGVIWSETVSQSLDSLIEFADQTMYKAKRAGKNQIILDAIHLQPHNPSE